MVPDRFVTIALMSENRHLMQLHDELADEVRLLSSAHVKSVLSRCAVIGT